MTNPMNLWKRVTRVALFAWALYLTVALAAFSLDVHSPHEADAPACAFCIGHNVTGAVAAVAAPVLVAPTVCRRLQLWLARPGRALVAPFARADGSRAPPQEVFSFASI